MPIVSSGQIRNYQFVPVQGTKPACKQRNVKANHRIADELAHKLHDENVWHVIITKPIIFQFSVHLNEHFCCRFSKILLF